MKKILKKLKPFLRNKNISDIIVFGSTVKGKSKPADLDLAILQRVEDVSIIKDIKKELPFADVQLISFDNYFSMLSLVLFKEGYSVKKNKYIYDDLNLSPVKLFKYSLKTLSQSKKVMFERGLKSIDGINRISNRVILVPMSKSKEFEEFLLYWDLDIDSQEYELMPLLRKEQL